MAQTITRLYDSYGQASDVERALKQAGFTENEVSLVASGSSVPNRDADVTDTPAGDGAATGAGIGGAAGAAAGMLAGLGLLAIPGIGPVVAAGWLISTAAMGVAGAVAGGAAGGLVGALTSSGVSEDEAHVYAESVRRGGAMVTVRAPDDRVMEAQQILSRFPSVDTAARGDEYRKSGWTGFDESAGPYTPSDRDAPPRMPLV